MGGAGRLSQALDVLQTGAQPLQLVVLALVELGTLDLGQLVAQHLLQADGLTLLGEQLTMGLACRSQLTHETAHLLALGERARIAVEVVQLLAGAQQGHVLALSVHVHQQVLHDLEAWSTSQPWHLVDSLPSPIKGPAGNVEFLSLWRG